MEKKVFIERVVDGSWKCNFVPVSHVGTYLTEFYILSKRGKKITNVTISRSSVCRVCSNMNFANM